MKELQSAEMSWIHGNENQKLQKRAKKRPNKVITRVRARAPASSACEIPILCVLSKSADTGVRASAVINEVRKRFGLLNADDCKARYPASRKKITETIVKFAKKNLAMKNEVFSVGVEVPLGTWKITPKGIARLSNGVGDWEERYAYHDAILMADEEK